MPRSISILNCIAVTRSIKDGAKSRYETLNGNASSNDN